MTNIKKQIESVTKLHGGEREQTSKHASFIAWQLRERAKANGREPSPILKAEPAHTINDGRAFRSLTHSENAAMSDAVRRMKNMK